VCFPTAVFTVVRGRRFICGVELLLENPPKCPESGPTRHHNRLVRPVLGADSAWSPDGRKISLASARNYEIYTMKTDGTGLTNLTNNQAYDDVPNWQPFSPIIPFP
jgi:hypothetical protein